MKQKIVIKVGLHCDKCRAKALKIAAGENGVNSVALEGNDRNEVVVTGEGVDAASLTCCLRKKFKYACLVRVEEVKPKPEEKKKPNPEEEKKTTPQYLTCYEPRRYELYEVVYDPNPPAICTIL